jgi:transposase
MYVLVRTASTIHYGVARTSIGFSTRRGRKCPELNPVENVWQFMRDNWLSNRIFKSYDDLVDHCCEAWNKLVD